MAREPARCDIPRRGQGWRHPRQCQLTGGISLRQSRDRDECDGGRAANQREKLLFLGSSCIYPKLAPQPIEEDALLTGSLEPPTKGTPSPRSPA